MADDADRRAVQVLDELDGIARGVCHYDYGLPLFDAISGPELRRVVADAIRAAVAAERERCAALALRLKRTTGPGIDPDDEVDAQSARIAAAIREGTA